MEEEDYEVEKVVAQRSGRGGRVEYQVKWVGWPLEDCTWEPVSALADCQGVLREWEARHQVADEAAAPVAPKTLHGQQKPPPSSDAPAPAEAPRLATTPLDAPARARASKKRAAESKPSGGKPTEEPEAAALGDGKAAKRAKPAAAVPSAAPRAGAKAARGTKAGGAKAAGTKAAGVKAAAPPVEEVAEVEVMEASDSEDDAQPAPAPMPAAFSAPTASAAAASAPSASSSRAVSRRLQS